MVTAGFHHKSVQYADAVVLQNAVQVGELRFVNRACDHQQLAAVFGVIPQHIQLNIGNVALGGVDHHRIGFLWHKVHIQQGNGFQLDIFLFQCFRECGGQIAFPVTFQQVQDGQLLAHHIVNGGGDGTFTVKARHIGVGIIVGFVLVNIIIADAAVPFP